MGVEICTTDSESGKLLAGVLSADALGIVERVETDGGVEVSTADTDSRIFTPTCLTFLS